MSLGSNLFLKAALGVAPSCTIALALTKMFPSMGYAVFNFIVNGCLLICEIAVEKRSGRSRRYSFCSRLYIPCLSSGLPRCSTRSTQN